MCEILGFFSLDASVYSYEYRFKILFYFSDPFHAFSSCEREVIEVFLSVFRNPVE